MNWFATRRVYSRKMATSVVYEFGDVTVNVGRMEVTRCGVAVALEPKCFDVLTVLVEHRDRLVTKEELLEAVWKDTFVTPNALTRAIAQLRRGLGDLAFESRYIETVARRGYRFIAEVRVRPLDAESPSSAWQAPMQEALRRRDVGAALEVLQACLAAGPDPEARMALGRLLLVADPVAARRALELCVQEFTGVGRNRRAALAAAAVAASYVSGDGNRVAAGPWMQRAWRLVRDEGPCVERGWVAIFDIACNTDDPGVLREHCDMALEMARRFHDVDLEAKALADGGYALTALGEVAEGTARVDEALAVVTAGQISDPVVVAEILCSFFTSVALTGDLGRCEAWGRVFRERGLVGSGAHPITTSHCDSVYGGLLCKLGRFSEAESTLTRAFDEARATMYAGRLHALSSLAELRIQQGRLSEAEELLRGHDDFMEALIPRASLYLARGAFDLAAATARRGLRLLGADRTRAVTLLCTLVDAELGRGNLAGAQTACGLLDARVTDTSLPALAAEAACVRARLRSAAGDPTGAISQLETALEACAPLQVGPLSAKLHLALARLHGDADPGAALVEAQAAAAALARLDMVVPEDDLAFLRAVGAWPVTAARENAAPGRSPS